MAACPRCGKAVYFAERKTSLGYDWHPQCLKCEMCEKTLQPGRHSEHNGKPYCDIPCYQALFGPEGYGRGGVEAHKAFGNGVVAEPKSPLAKEELLGMLKSFNAFHQGTPFDMKYKEVNGSVLVEGVMRIYWGLSKAITVAGGDQMYVGRQQGGYTKQEDLPDQWRREVRDIQEQRISRYLELEAPAVQTPPDEARSQQRKVEKTVSFNIQPLEEIHFNSSDVSDETQSEGGGSEVDSDTSPVQMRRFRAMTSVEKDSLPVFRRTSSISHRRQAVKKRSSSMRKSTRFSVIQVENEPTSFTPPYGSAVNVRINSTYLTQEVIKQLLMKYKVLDDPSHFTLCMVYDSGRKETCDKDFPLLARLRAGPDERVAKLYIVESDSEVGINVSAEAAQFIRFQLPELELFLKKFDEEEAKQVEKLKQKYQAWKDEIQQRMNELS